jgi:hypothetical protein
VGSNSLLHREIRIVLTDTGNDTLGASCSDDTVNAVLMGKASAFTELTGAQQLAVIMCKAAHDYLAGITKSRAQRRLIMPRKKR